ncbi:MAG: DUF1684 domain-containing protein [Phycisphaerales bacterium]
MTETIAQGHPGPAETATVPHAGRIAVLGGVLSLALLGGGCAADPSPEAPLVASSAAVHRTSGPASGPASGPTIGRTPGPESTMPPSSAVEARSFIEAADAWHAERLASLQAEDGWLSLVALGWLEPGVNRVARDGDAAVSYAGLPHAELGTITVGGSGGSDAGAVVFRPAAGVTVDGLPDNGHLVTDAEGTPTIIRAGTCQFHVIERGGRLAVRLKDSAAATRTEFRGIDRFPVDPSLRVDAELIAVGPGLTVPRQTIAGYEEVADVAGRARFTLGGHACDIVLHPGGAPGTYFVVFGDETNGAGAAAGERTYPGGRFLSARTTAPGRVELDFNRAYNPPCSFTPFATCPMPVADNRLPLAIRAGERWSAPRTGAGS